METKTVKIEAKLHRKLRLVSVKGGHTLQDLMNDILKTWLRSPQRWDTDRLMKCKDLLREVCANHSDERSSDYNQCDTSPCQWCKEALEVLE